MKRTAWIIFDFFLAIIISILGKFVADYLKVQYGLSKPENIGIVIVLFVIVLVISLTITLLKHKETVQPQKGESQVKSSSFNVNQKIKELYGTLIGIKVQRIIGGIYKVEQKIAKIGNGGSAIGIEITDNVKDGKIEVEQKVKKVEKNASLIGIKKDN